MVFHILFKTIIYSEFKYSEINQLPIQNKPALILSRVRIIIKHFKSSKAKTYFIMKYILQDVST